MNNKVNAESDPEIFDEINYESLQAVWAHEIQDNIQFPDELIQDVLLTDGLSVFYGDSNSGKTFFTIDMAACIARGEKWRDKNTEQGLVVYLASEGPSSVERRIFAYQKFFNLIIPDFLIVKKPINLFTNDEDRDALIRFITHLEKKNEKKVKFIVGDTLASISAGADENSGKDMGQVINRAGIIKNECKTHLCLIHHTGKNISAGARGWSGLRAAIDTEIEITESPNGNCAEVTKLRDLGKKGERFGFKLHPFAIGKSKWNTPLTSCIVQPSEPIPKKSSSKQKALSVVAGAIMQFLYEKNSGKTRVEIRQGIGHHSTSQIYAQIDNLTESGKLINNCGIYVINKN